MSKKGLLSTVVVLAFVVLGVGIWHFSKQSPAPASSPAPVASQTQQPTPAPWTPTLLDAAGNPFSNPQPGQVINGMRIAYIGSYTNDPTPSTSTSWTDTPSEDDVTVSFTGTTTLTGDLHCSFLDAAGQNICFFTPSSDSRKKLPRLGLSGEDALLHSQQSFALQNTQTVMNIFGTEDTSTTIVIDDYTIYSYPIEGSDSALFVSRVRSVSAATPSVTSTATTTEEIQL